LAGERILVVDDETAISELVCEALKRQDSGLNTAADGDTALEKAEASLPEPHPAGPHAAEARRLGGLPRLKNQPETKRIPIMMLTARAGRKGSDRGAEIGADDYLKKPFSLGELVARTKALIRRSVPKRLSKRPSRSAP
jgi:DNA-binding response OmpR family regulator